MGSDTHKYQLFYKFNHVIVAMSEGHSPAVLQMQGGMYSSTPGNLPVLSGLVGLSIQREKRVWAQFHLAVPRIRRESWQMGLSTARTQPPFPSQENGRNRSLGQRVRASGCWVSVINVVSCKFLV